MKKIYKVIDVEVKGEPEEGYILGSLSTNLNQIYLEGPESLINQVSYAMAQINVDGVRANVSSTVPIKLYDAQGKEIDDERITMNIHSVSVNQEVLVTKEVPLEFDVGGTPAEGYALTGDITSDIQTIVIAGRKATLDDIDSIVIPESVLNVDGLQSNLEVNVKLQNYLPANVIFAYEEMNVTTQIKVEVQKETFVTMTFDRTDITVVNVPQGYKAEILADGNYITAQETNVRLYGLAEILESYDADDAKATVDISAYMSQNGITELTPGTYSVTPDFGLPEGAYMKDNFKIQIRITENP